VSLEYHSINRKYALPHLPAVLAFMAISTVLTSRFMTPGLGHFTQTDSAFKYQKNHKWQCFERTEVDWAPPAAVVQISLLQVVAQPCSPQSELLSQLSAKGLHCNRAPPVV
jgi:hypothetical protein